MCVNAHWPKHQHFTASWQQLTFLRSASSTEWQREKKEALLGRLLLPSPGAKGLSGGPCVVYNAGILFTVFSQHLITSLCLVSHKSFEVGPPFVSTSSVDNLSQHKSNLQKIIFFVGRLTPEESLYMRPTKPTVSMKGHPWKMFFPKNFTLH